jgi:hypothetical protein
VNPQKTKTEWDAIWEAAAEEVLRRTPESLGHPSEIDFIFWSGGDLSKREAAWIEAHLKVCSECAAREAADRASGTVEERARKLRSVIRKITLANELRPRPPSADCHTPPEVRVPPKHIAVPRSRDLGKRPTQKKAQ